MKIFIDGNSDQHITLSRYMNWYDKPGHLSDYYNEWVIANNGEPPRRKSRMSPSIFKGKRFLVMVKDVTKDRKGYKRPNALEYSKIDKILELLPE
jgi:hypothetical protein